MYCTAYLIMHEFSLKVWNRVKFYCQKLLFQFFFPMATKLRITWFQFISPAMIYSLFLLTHFSPFLVLVDFSLTFFINFTIPEESRALWSTLYLFSIEFSEESVLRYFIVYVYLFVYTFLTKIVIYFTFFFYVYNFVTYLPIMIYYQFTRYNDHFYRCLKHRTEIFQIVPNFNHSYIFVNRVPL